MSKNPTTVKKPTLYNDQSECSGCSGCQAICPQGAVSMKVDETLFTYPYVDENKCVGCSLCEKVCPLKDDEKENITSRYTRAYAVRHRSEDVIKVSSSGGVFTLISDYALRRGWGVCCCVYDYDLNCTRFKIITSRKERDAARGSKYIYSHMENVFREGLHFLRKNKEKRLLFVGLGCQAEGFRKYCELNHIRDRVIICDLICHGQAGEMFWKTQLKMLGLDGVKLNKVTFKDKKKGWEYPEAYVQMNAREYPIKEYNNLFYDGYIMRSSCYSCHFTKLDRKTDLTIGDFWGVKSNYPELYDRMGVSLVLVHSSVGVKILETVKKNALVNEVDIHKCLQPRLLSPLDKPKDYDEFWTCVSKKGVEKSMKKYGKASIQEICRDEVRKFKCFVKRILCR